MKTILLTCSMIASLFVFGVAKGQTYTTKSGVGPFEIASIDNKSVTFKATTKTPIYNVAFVSGDQTIDATFISNSVGDIVFSNGATARTGSQLLTPKANNWESVTMDLPVGTMVTCSFSNIPAGFIPQKVMFQTKKDANAMYFTVPKGSVVAANTVKYKDQAYVVSLGNITDDGKGAITVEILTEEKISIPMTESGALAAPIMMKIEAGGKTITASDKVSILDKSMSFNFGEVPEKVIVYGNDGNANGPTVTFDVKKSMVKTTAAPVVTTTTVQQPQPATQQTQSAVTQQTQPVAQQTQPAMQSTQPTQPTTQPEVAFTPKANSLATTNDQLKRWYLEAGLSIGILVPDPIDVMACVGGAIDFGFYINRHNRLSMDIGIGGHKREIGTFEYTKTYTDGTKKSFTDGVINRSYTSTSFLLSYHYVFTPSEKFHIRLGSSFGAINLSASYSFTPEIDNAPDKNEKSEAMAAFGLSFGFTWNFSDRWFLDSGYKLLVNEGLQLDDFEITAPAHQLSLTLGWRF